MPELSINYAHAWETMIKGIDDQGPYYTVSYRFANWSDADDVANQLRGYTSRAGTTTIRVGPHQHPLSSNLCCMDVALEGCGSPILNSSGLPSYSGGFLAHCTYRSPPYSPYQTQDPNNANQIDPTTPVLWCTQELDFEEEVYVLERNQYVWESDGKASKIPVKVTVGVTSMNFTYHQLPYLPMATLRSLRNKVNNATFLGAATGMIWFKGLRTVREKGTDGTVSQRVQMVLKEREVEWNKYLRDDGTWDYLKNPSNNRVLAAADLSPLLVI